MKVKFDITGRYSIVTNQNRGFIDIIQAKDGTVWGKMCWYMSKSSHDPKDEFTEDTFKGDAKEIVDYNKRQSIEINFTREANPKLKHNQKPEYPQRFRGWFSEDQNMISGYFECDKQKKDQKEDEEKIAYRMPWYADRHVFPEKGKRRHKK